MSELKVREVRALLKILKENGVTKFEGLGLNVVIEPTIAIQSTSTASQIKGAAKKADAIEQDALVSENADTIEDQLAMLLIEDPAKYEQLIREGELKGGETQYSGSEPAVQ